jgi:hypothetical protein
VVQFRDRHHTPCCTCAGPIFCPFFPLARFTVKRSRISYSRTSATRRTVNKNLTFHFCDKHAGVAEVEFISFPSTRFFGITMCRETAVFQLPGDALRLIIRSRMWYDQEGPIDSGNAFIHSIFAETLYTSNMDVGCSQWGVSASTMTPQHHTGSARPHFPKIHPHLQMYNSIRMPSYAHPQHLNMLKHCVYIQYGCGMQLMGVGSLNHDTPTSYRLGHTPTPTYTCISAA